MKIRHFLPALALTVGAGLYIGHIAVATAHNIADARIAQLGCTTDAECEALTGYDMTGTPVAWKKPTTNYSVDAYEDGSGVLYDGDTEIATYGEGFFPWDCTDNGNEICGPKAPSSIRGYKCKTFRYHAAKLQYCTDGTTRVISHRG